jgi:hypothetical protein
VNVEAQEAPQPYDSSSCFCQLSLLNTEMGHSHGPNGATRLARSWELRDALGTEGMAKDALGGREMCLDGWHYRRMTQRKRVDSACRPLANGRRKIPQPMKFYIVMLFAENVSRNGCLWAPGTECGPICTECESEAQPICTECEPNQGDICGSEGLRLWATSATRGRIG